MVTEHWITNENDIERVFREAVYEEPCEDTRLFIGNLRGFTIIDISPTDKRLIRWRKFNEKPPVGEKKRLRGDYTKKSHKI